MDVWPTGCMLALVLVCTFVCLSICFFCFVGSGDRGSADLCNFCVSSTDGFGSVSVPVSVAVYVDILVHICDYSCVSLSDSSRRVSLCFSYWRKSGVRLA